MKKNILILLILPLISCSQQQDFDLSKLTFPVSKDSLLSKFKLREQITSSIFKNYDSKEKEIMFFDNLSLYGSNNRDKDSYYMANHVSFYEETKSSKIDAYEIMTRTTNESLELQKLLIKKLGKPYFFYKNETTCNQVWETIDKTYFLNLAYTSQYDGRKVVSCNLYIVNNKNELLYNWQLAGAFQYYGDYIEKKKKRKNKKYTYLDFVLEDEEIKSLRNSTSYYSKDYVR